MEAILFFLYEKLLFVPFCQFKHLRDDVFNVFFLRIISSFAGA